MPGCRMDGADLGAATGTSPLPDARSALRSVKAVGAREVEQRRPTPLSRGAWQAINDRYEQLREAAGLPLTYDGVWLIATRP